MTVNRQKNVRPVAGPRIRPTIIYMYQVPSNLPEKDLRFGGKIEYQQDAHPWFGRAFNRN